MLTASEMSCDVQEEQLYRNRRPRDTLCVLAKPSRRHAPNSTENIFATRPVWICPIIRASLDWTLFRSHCLIVLRHNCLPNFSRFMSFVFASLPSSESSLSGNNQLSCVLGCVWATLSINVYYVDAKLLTLLTQRGQSSLPTNLCANPPMSNKLNEKGQLFFGCFWHLFLQPFSILPDKITSTDALSSSCFPAVSLGQHRRDTGSIHTLCVICDLDICGHDVPVRQYRLTASCQLGAAEGCDVIEVVMGVLRRQ